ncbi:MAG: MarR family transcriptional regulator [Rhodospirillales bacterium]
MPLSDLSALELFHRTIVKTVREDSPDLSARQMALLLTVYLTEPPHTVRGMAKLLNVSKPAITRALDRLTSLKLIRRKKDDDDRRNVLIQRTVRGSVFLREYGKVIVAAARDLGIDSGEADTAPRPEHSTEAVNQKPPSQPKADNNQAEPAAPDDDDKTWFTEKL